MLRDARTELHGRLVGERKHSIFGDHTPLREARLEAERESDRAFVSGIQLQTKRDTLSMNAIFPGSMLAACLLLVPWFRSRGGYRPVVLGG